jgi:hypothetical protein
MNSGRHGAKMPLLGSDILSLLSALQLFCDAIIKLLQRRSLPAKSGI